VAWYWIGFIVFILVMLTLDLGLFHRRARIVSLREASLWSAVWVGLAFGFNGLILWTQGSIKGLEFLTGYLIELSLSVDNLFVFVMIFHYFAVPAQYQHRVLLWGIIGALIMRGIFIALGALLLARFHWIIYLFGGFLILTGIKMALQPHGRLDPEKNLVLRFCRRIFSVTPGYEGQRFLVRRERRFWLTPLFLVLVVVETTDLIFAVDSVPAIFAVTRDPFIVYTSNVFAVLGLRSFYFLLAGVVNRFRFLKFGLAIVLCFVGAKMLLAEAYPIPIGISLGIVGGVLALSVFASLLFHSKEEH